MKPWPEHKTDEALQLLALLGQLVETAIESGLNDREAEEYTRAVIALAELAPAPAP